MKRLLLLIGLSVASLVLLGCSSKKESAKVKETIVVATKQVPIKHLYFSGVIQPIKTVSVLSPVDGTIEKLNFVYGQNVKKGQLLAVVNSLKLMDTFREAVSSFLSKKTEYLTQAQNFQGAQVLYRAGVISEQDYVGEKNTYENSVLDFFQEEYQLKKVLTTVGIEPGAIEKLNISDTGKIQKLFAKQFNRLNIIAPSTGVALFPLPAQGQGDGSGDSGSGSGSSNAISVGSQLHEAQLILSIGDLEGFSIDMNVNEVNIDSIKQGMKATVTGDAFAQVTLSGFVSYVASQAQPAQGGDSSGGSVFKVNVSVPKVDGKDLRSVHVGMTAKIDLPIKGAPQIMLPIDAVFKKDDVNYVTIVDEKGRHKDVPVITGDTTLTDVVILSGVVAGQKVVVRDQV